MLQELSRQLSDIAEQKRLKAKLEQDLKAVEEELGKTSLLLQTRTSELEKEQVDVEKLEQMSLTSLFYSVLGSRDEQLEKERQELLSTQLKHGQTKHQLEYLQRELSRLQERLEALKDIDARYESLLAEKERLLQQTNQAAAAQLLDFSKQAADINAELREITEAITAGNEVLADLDEVIDSLSSAEGWGTWDMLGGGLIATAIKHSRIDEARDHIHDVQAGISRFQRELADVQQYIDINIEISGFESFADYFFDGLIMDWIVQSKIEDSLSRAQDARTMIEQVIQQLESLRNTTESKSMELQEKKATLIELA